MRRDAGIELRVAWNNMIGSRVLLTQPNSIDVKISAPIPLDGRQ